MTIFGFRRQAGKILPKQIPSSDRERHARAAQLSAVGASVATPRRMAGRSGVKHNTRSRRPAQGAREIGKKPTPKPLSDNAPRYRYGDGFVLPHDDRRFRRTPYCPINHLVMPTMRIKPYQGMIGQDRLLCGGRRMSARKFARNKRAPSVFRRALS